MTQASMRGVPAGALLAILLAASPQALRADDPASGSALDFAGLEEKADEVVKVNLWGRSLDQAKKLLGLRKNVTGPVRSFMSGLTAVYRRTYRFRGGNASEDDLAPVHRRLTEAGWVPLIETEDRSKPTSLSVYSYHADEQVTGMTVVSSDEGEVTVLKIMGPVDFEALSEIGSGLGLPVMHLGTTDLKQAGTATPEK